MPLVESIEMEHAYDDLQNPHKAGNYQNVSTSNVENRSSIYMTVNQFRLLIGLLLGFLVAAVVFIGLAAFLINPHTMAELSGPHTSDSCQTPTVVFSANLRSIADVIEGRTLIFPMVTSNLGSGYNNTSGYFTAPYSGTYLFHTNVCAIKKKWVYVDLVANGSALGTTGTRDEYNNGTCTSASGVVVMTGGDQAWVQGAHDGKGALYYNSKYNTLTFSGVLLHKECNR